MSTRIAVNKEVTVTALSFGNRKELKPTPRRIEYDGASYTFLDSGFQYLVKQGQRFVRIFDMTDGTANFRLCCDDGQYNWTLIAITR